MVQFVDHVHHLCSQFVPGFADEPQMPHKPSSRRPNAPGPQASPEVQGALGDKKERTNRQVHSPRPRAGVSSLGLANQKFQN